MRRTLVFSLLLLCADVSASAAPAPGAKPAARPAPFTLEHALTLNAISSLTWSADGRRLAFVVTAVDTAENTTNQDLWLYEHATARTARRVRPVGEIGGAA